MNFPSSAWSFRPARTLTLLAAALLLNACGTNGPSVPEPEPEPALSIAAVNPVAAVAGATVVVTGEGFGQGGSVLIGDVLAHTVSWTEDLVEVVIPQAALPAWQTLTVASSDNGEDQAELFVGHAFTGAPTDFQGFLDSLPAGSHVLLPAGILGLDGQNLALNGVHLHGAPTGTSLDFGGGSLSIIVGAAPAASLNGLAVNADHAGYTAAIAGANVLSPGWVNTAVSLRQVAFQGRQFGEHLREPLGPLVAGDLVVVDSSFTTSGGAALVGHPHVHVSGSRVAGPEVTVGSVHGDTKVTSSELLGVTATALRGARDVELLGSTARSAHGGVTLRASPQAQDPSFVPRVHVSTSVVEALYDSAIDGRPPVIEILVTGGDLELIDNERIHARVDIDIEVNDGRRLVIKGNDELSAGRLDASVPDDHLPEQIDIWLDSNGPYEVELTGNTVHFEGRFTVSVESHENGSEGTSGNNILTFTDNALRSTGLTASSIDVEARGDHATNCVVSRNIMEISAPEDSQEVALGCRPRGQDVEFEVTQNRIAVSGPQGEILTRSTGTGTTTVTDNVMEVMGSLSLRADGTELIAENNRISANRVTMDRYGAGNSNGRFSFNNVTVTEAQSYALRIYGEGPVELTGNTVEHVGTAAPGSLALYFVTTGQLEVNVQQNVFTNLGRALRFDVESSSIEGSLNNNVFDFPIEVAPDAVLVRAFVDSSVILDLRANRWGQVQSPGQLDDLIEIAFDDTSMVSLDFSTVLTD
ncbi:MAG: IPT/TIG domain-containing protein [Trueperaceae bacterium]